MSSQHYSLRWNNHQSHVLSAFDTLLQNESLVDCTLVCEDTSIRAHKVVLSACSPYFQKIFTDNSCKHPIIVLKDIKGWEVSCIVDFMYKGETSVPESQLSCLIKAAESLKVRGLTSSDQQPPPYRRCPHDYGGSSTTSSSSRGAAAAKIPHLTPPFMETGGGGLLSRSESPPGGHPHAHIHHHHPFNHQNTPIPRRKQARPRRRSGDSIGGASSSLDLSRKSPEAPENLCMKEGPAINLVKTETLLEPVSLGGGGGESLNGSSSSFSEKSSPKYGQIQEQEARVEALQALNYMASGGGLPGSSSALFPLNAPSSGASGPLHPVSLRGSPLRANSSSHNSTTTPSGGGGQQQQSKSEKSGFEFQRISIDRSKMSEEEAFEHAIEMIQTRQMGFRKAADFFSVSKWKLYKTARKRGIYAEIKKQNQAQQSLSKVPSNVQHFADMGVYKQLKKKAHLTKEILFPHLPTQSDTETLKSPLSFQVYKAPTNNNNAHTPNSNTSNNNNNNNKNVYTPNLLDLQKKLFVTGSKGKPGPHGPPLGEDGEAVEEDIEDEDEELEDEERVLVINHRELPEEETEIDSDRDDSA